MFLAVASFFRRFVSNFVKIVSPLVKLLKSSCTLECKSRHEACFDETECKFKREPILDIFSSNATKPELHTDASSEGFGSNVSPNQHSDCEKSYHSCKLELSTIVCVVEKIRQFLITIHVNI